LVGRRCIAATGAIYPKTLSVPRNIFEIAEFPYSA